MEERAKRIELEAERKRTERKITELESERLVLFEMLPAEDARRIGDTNDVQIDQYHARLSAIDHELEQLKGE